MANIKFFYNNLLTGSLATLKNGTGGGAPALSEDADFPMSNLRSPDRYSVWVTGATPPDPMQVDFSVLAATTLKAFGVARHDTDWVDGPVEVYYSTSAYLPGGWSLGPTFTPLAGRTNMLVESTIASVRSLRFSMSAHTLTSAMLGNFLAYKDSYDLGHEGAAGSVDVVRKWRSRSATISGLPVINKIGVDRRQIVLSLPTVTSATRAILQALIALDDPFTIQIPNGEHVHVTFAEDQLDRERLFAAAELSSFRLVLEELP